MGPYILLNFDAARALHTEQRRDTNLNQTVKNDDQTLCAYLPVNPGRLLQVRSINMTADLSPLLSAVS